MDTSAWVSVVGAAVGAIGAAIAIWQAKAATKQVTLGALQLQEMREANEISKQVILDEKEGRKLKLDIEFKMDSLDGRTWPIAVVRNNSRETANVQEISAVFADNSLHVVGVWGGEISLSRTTGYDLPAKLEPGQECYFRFVHRVPKTLNGRSFLDDSPPDINSGKWPTLDRVTVKASNQFFSAPFER